jgi:hypothetical protein
MRTRKRYSALNLRSLSLHLVGLVFYLVTVAMGQISQYSVVSDDIILVIYWDKSAIGKSSEARCLLGEQFVVK